MKKGLLLIIAFVFAVSCNKEELVDNDVKLAIGNDIVLFNQNDIPISLSNYLEENEIVLFGETHFVQEHQNFIVALLNELSSQGYRIIFEEQFHCFNWMIEDYIHGELDELPAFLRYFNETLIEGIKNFNNTVEDSLKFDLVYMDVNHWKSNFGRCLEEIEHIIGTQSIFSAVQNAKIDSEDYKTELLRLLELLEDEHAHYISLWGERWYNRVMEIIPVEVKSSEFRTNRNSELRESVMFDNINSAIQNQSRSKCVINTGMSHAQKHVYMDGNLERIGKRLNAAYDKIISIAFVSMKGERKLNFSDDRNIPFNLPKNTSSDDIIQEIDKLSHNNMTFLPLSNEVFSNREVKVTYWSGTTIKAPIGKQFDAIITYPEASVLYSMDLYDWR